MIGPGNNFYYNAILRWWEYTGTQILYRPCSVLEVKGVKCKSPAVTAVHSISSFLCDLSHILVCAFLCSLNMIGPGKLVSKLMITVSVLIKFTIY